MASLGPEWKTSADGKTLEYSVKMDVVIRQITDGLATKIDQRILKTAAWVERLVVRARPEDDPAFDREAQAEALYFLRLLREQSSIEENRPT